MKPSPSISSSSQEFSFDIVVNNFRLFKFHKYSDNSSSKGLINKMLELLIIPCKDLMK